MKCWFSYVLLICASLLLWSCDNTDRNTNNQIDKITVGLPAHADTVSESYKKNLTFPSHSSSQSFELNHNLLTYYQDKELTVLDSFESILDGVSTLVVTFSIPLDPKHNFSNVIRLVETGKGAVDGYWELSANGLELHHRYLPPKRQFAIHIDKKLTAFNGKNLNNNYNTTLQTRDRKPMVRFSSNGSLLPSKSMTGLPITTLNIDQIDVDFFRIKTDQIPQFMQHYGAIKQLSVWASADALSYADLVYSARFDLAPRANVQENVIVNLANISALQQEGLYIAILKQAGTYQASNSITTFSISNIGIAVHAYDKGKLAVFAHRLDNGQALSNIKLTALCKANSDSCSAVTQVTNQQGYAELALQSISNYALITASNGEQISYVYLDAHALDLSEFNILGDVYYQKQLFTFAPRDLYRPNETVYLNALLRDADGKLLPEQPIKVEVISPTGQVNSDFIWKSDKKNSGFYQTEFFIPNNAVNGKWAFKLNLGDDIYRYHYFTVEQFLPERMALSLASISEKPILHDQNIRFSVKGWYLYGVPASGNKLQTNVSILSESTVPQLAGFKIGSIIEKNIVRQLNSVEQNLNNQGEVVIDVDNKNWDEIHSPIQVILQASLLDIGGRPVTRSISQIVWPADCMPAVKAMFTESHYYDWSINQYVNRPTVNFGDKANFEIAYIDKNGNKLSSDQLTVRLIKERRDYYWTWSDNEGWQAKFGQKEITLSEEKIVVIANKVNTVSFLPDDYGSYRIEVIDEKNHVTSSMRFWNGYSWRDNTDNTGAVRPDQVKLTLDKANYQLGDIAKVHIDAPVSGAGYISLETNDGTLWMNDINIVKGGIDVEIPIKDWQRHDIYINAMVVRPSTDSAIETIKRAVGILYLPIDSSDRQLKLSIDLPEKVHPKKNVKVKINLANKVIKNHKVSVLLSAVDSSVLAATDFVTPDPYSALLGRKRYDVEQFDVYGKLIEGKGRQVGLNFGGDNDLLLSKHLQSNSHKSFSESTIVAQQFQIVELNANGEAEIDFAIPDFNGELRVMAQAWDDNRFGSSEKTVNVAAPIIAELTAPHFLSGGDKTVMALELRNLTDVTQNISIDVITEGLISINYDSLPQRVRLKAQEHVILQIPAVANDGFGVGRITLNVSNIKLVDDKKYYLSRSWALDVRPAYVTTSRSLSVALSNGEGWKFSSSALSDMIDNTVEADIVISHKPPLNITTYIKSLYSLPYGSLEQTVSHLYPLLYINEERLKKLGVPIEGDEQRHHSIQVGIDQIFSMQRTNGSFGLWSKENSEEYWLTVYAVDFLLRAQDRGYRVNQRGLNNALERLAQYLYNPSAFFNLNSYYGSEVEQYMVFATKSYAVMILARQQKITPAIRNEIKKLYQRIKSNEHAVLFSPLPIMQLSIASKLTGNNRSANDLLIQALSVERDPKYYWLGDYGSAIRDKAQIYDLMIEYNLVLDLQADYLLKLSKALRDEHYLSTQELSSLFIAGWENIQHEKDDDLVVLLNNRERVKSKQTIYRTMDFKQLVDGISVHNPYNSPPVYINYTLSGYTKKKPEPTPVDSMFSISKQYFDMKGQPITAEHLNIGDLVIVMLDIDSHRIINDAFVIDMLPAGLEIENPNLSHNSIDINKIAKLAELLKSENTNDIKYQAYRDDRYVASIDIHNKVADDRYRTRLIYLARAVKIGEYSVPAPYVKSMYRPEWYAVGNSIDLMTVSNKK